MIVGVNAPTIIPMGIAQSNARLNPAMCSGLYFFYFELLYFTISLQHEISYLMVNSVYDFNENINR